jgi:hypothetical protein
LLSFMKGSFPEPTHALQAVENDRARPHLYGG